MIEPMFNVFIEGLECYAYHGVADAERQIGHRFLVDIEMEVAGRADITDDVADTADYYRAVQIAQEAMDAQPCRTVERLAAQICDQILAQLPIVVSVRTTVSKQLPPMPAICAASGATVARDRG